MLAAGLISGTSQDGIDAVLAEFEGSRFVRVLAHRAGAYPDELRRRLIELSHESQRVSLHDWAALDRAVADGFADTAVELLRLAGVAPAAVAVLGSHGQTVFHDPLVARNTLQLGDPSRIAARTGIPTVADFRRKDIALGGQGAPLVCAFHHALFARPDENRAVLNLGGVANLTRLAAGSGSAQGFDTGPANALMDEWTLRYRGEPFDADGAWAACGVCVTELLAALLADPYFALAPPKSTGRGQFHLDWVHARFPALDGLAPADVQRTLCELTSASVAQALAGWLPGTQRLLVCGGGARNGFLSSRLRALLPGIVVESTAEHGLDPQWVEATAFAWLAVKRLRGETGSMASVTGATRDTVLGGLFLP